ncbi:MAG: ferredoxin [Ilumatobacter sp.]|jgi:ferredoxin|uniref:ferredoxin n=1 Tax=Ilumatobacter sp. TaxID=1967498 RepID=UPI00391BAA9F
MSAQRQLTISADTSTCAGTRQCVLHHPEVFGHDDRNLVVVLHREVADSDLLRDAIEVCPTQSLAATDPSTGEIVYGA